MNMSKQFAAQIMPVKSRAVHRMRIVIFQARCLNWRSWRLTSERMPVSVQQALLMRKRDDGLVARLCPTKHKSYNNQAVPLWRMQRWLMLKAWRVVVHGNTLCRRGSQRPGQRKGRRWPAHVTSTAQQARHPLLRTTLCRAVILWMKPRGCASAGS